MNSFENNEFSLITGASGGIGSNLCIELSKDHNLILSGKSLDKLEKLRKQCDRSDEHLLWVIDLDSERIEIEKKLTNLLKSNNIVVTSFIHCAGVTKLLPLRNFSSVYINQIFNINVFSAIEIIRALLKKTNARSLNTILFISALWSIRGNSGNSIYAASKGALNSLVYSLAQELAPVRVNSLLPGAIITSMSSDLSRDFIERINNETPLGIGSVEDVVNYALFIVSDKAKWITGQNIVIDGGRSTK